MILFSLGIICIQGGIMKINVHLLGLMLCFLGCTLYLLFDAHHTHATDTAEPTRRTGGPLFKAKPEYIMPVPSQELIPHPVRVWPVSRFAKIEQSIHQHMDALVREAHDLAKVTELTKELQRLVNEYIELATQELKKCITTQP